MKKRSAECRTSHPGLRRREGSHQLWLYLKCTVNIYTEFCNLERSLSHSVTALFSLCPGSQSGKGRLGSLGSRKRRHHQEEKRSWHDLLEHGLCAASRWNPREEARPQGEGSMVPFWKLGPRLLAPSLSKVFCAPRQPKSSKVHTLKGMMQNEITSYNQWQMVRRPLPGL